MDVLIDRTSRFTPGYDLQYRFRAPCTFNYNARTLRPHTSDGNASSFKSKGQLQLDVIAEAQESSVEAFRRGLEESLMIIQSGRTEVDPSTFCNLNKFHILNLRQERDLRQSNSNPRRRMMNRRPWTSDEGLHAARRKLWSRRAQTEDTDVRTTSRQRADELKKSFVEFISKIDHQSTVRPKTYQHHSEYLSNRAGPEDRCQRCTGYPQIRIDGRKIGGLSGEGTMARQHCDVLGMTMCPDCIRTRARNDHFRKCNASVSERVIDVYKLAVAKQRIPSLKSLNDVVSYQSSARQGEAKVISVSSLDSSGKHVTKISIEATEKLDHDAKNPNTSTPKSPVQTAKVPEHSSTETDASSTDESMTLEVSRTNGSPTNEASKSNFIDSESAAHNQTIDDTSKRKRKDRKKSPKSKLKLFNKDVVPSPDYFSDMSDLQHRIRSHRKSKRIHFLEIEALAEEIQTKQQEDKAKFESTQDDNFSETSRDPSSPRPRQSPKIYEPPILFGQRPSVLGVAVE